MLIIPDTFIHFKFFLHHFLSWPQLFVDLSLFIVQLLLEPPLFLAMSPSTFRFPHFFFEPFSHT
jgi:hypothetical protein